MSRPVEADPRIGSEIGGYRIERVLGRGGMSVVYLAEDLRLDRKVALKLLGPELSGDARFRDRFLRASGLMASIDHASVIPVYEAGEAGGFLFVAMRYVEGVDLRRLLVEEGPLDRERAVDLASKAAGGLDASRWGRGLVHGSVRPSNILVEAVADAASVGRVGLVGFGLWQQVDRASLLADGAREVGYLAPEQVMGEEPSSRSDQYALACVLCECLTGQPPFTGNAGAVLGGHLRERPISLREPGPELPAGIDLAIAKALGKRPEDRFGTCSEFASALTALPAVGETRPVLSVEPGWAVGETAAALPDGPAGARRRSTAATRDETEPTPSPRPARVSPGQLAPLAIAAVAAAIAIVLAVLLLSNGSDEPASIAAEPLSGDADPAASNTEPLPGNEPAATATEPLPADLELFSGRPAPELAGPASVASPAPRVSLLWSRISLDEAVFGGVGDLVMSSVAAGRLGLVAVGRDDPVAAVWTSADGVNWSRVPDEESVFSGEGNTVMLSVTAGGPGLVAVGSDSKRAVVWTSVDGLTWSRVPHDEAIFGGDLNPIMNDVTAGGPGLVAVGSDCAGLCTDASPHSAAVWTSVDGVSWSRVPHDEAVFGGEGIQAMESVAAGGPGLVAVGADNPDDFGYTGAVWTSVDGLTWSRVPDDEEVFAHAQIGSVSAGGPGLVAVGFGSNSDLGPNGLSAAVWTSIDGRSWSRVPHDEAVFGGEGLQAMEGVTAGGPGLVAVGRDCPNRCLGSSTGDAAAPVWTSVDGVTWSRVSPGGTVLDGEMWGVSVGGPGLVAVGRVKRDTPGPFRDAAAWTSADGLGWSRVSQEQEVFGAAEMVSVAAGGLGLVAVGRPKPEGGARTVPPDERHALVWASVDGVVWSRVPHDEAVFGEGSFIADVTAGGPGLVAVGGDSEGGAVWTSVDGLSWSRAADDAAVAGGAGAVELGSVTVGGPGLVAVGRDEQGAAVWTSVDGLTWSRVPDQDSLVGGWMIGVTAGGPGIVAVGVDDSDGDGAPDGAVWTSVDGFAWSRVSRDEAVSGEGSFFFDVTAGGPGLVAVSDGGLWASVDGTTWSRVPTDETGQPVATDVVANGPGLVAVGSNGRDPWVGTSPDGVSWLGLPNGVAAALGSADEEPGFSGVMNGVTVGGPGLVAVGTVGPDAAVWTSAEVGEASPVAPGSIFRFDPVTNQGIAIETGLTAGAAGLGVAVGEGTVWAFEPDGNSLAQIDPGSNRVVKTVEIVGQGISSVAIGEESVWVTRSLAGEGVLVETDSDTGRFRRAVSLAVRPALELGYFDVMSVATGAGALWVAAAGSEGSMLLRINPATGEVVAAIPLSDEQGLSDHVPEVVVGQGAVWVVGQGAADVEGGRGTVWRIDPDTNEVIAAVGLAGPASRSTSIAVGAGAVWVADISESTLFQIDPATSRITASIPVDERPAGVAVRRGSVWVVHHLSPPLLSRIDPTTKQLIETIEIEGVPCGCSIAVGSGGIWGN